MANQTAKRDYSTNLNNWLEQEKAAVSLINSIGKLLYEDSVELVLFRNHLVDQSVSEILNMHEYANSVVKNPVTIFDTEKIAAEILKMDLAASKIDIGKLAVEYQKEGDNFDGLNTFLKDRIGSFVKGSGSEPEPRDVVLFGFGRIGRLAARELIKQFGKGQQLRLRAIVTRDDSDKTIIKRAALLRNDSVHGHFPGTVKEDLDKKELVINGQRVKMIGTNNPDQVDYTEYGIENAILIDNTGVFNNKEALSIHLKANGISKVVLTAPGSGIPNIVYGINQDEIDIENDKILSAASCTTNAISPVLKVVHDELGVEKGHIETVHAYTNDQNLLDNMHKKPRRGRSAAINMVITSTGAGKAVSKVIPDLDGRLTANAVRVPTPNGSLAILNLTVGKDTSPEEVNEIIRKSALEGELVNQINYQMDPELVSNDIIGNTCCSVFDSNATLVHNDKRNVVLYTWYDNEFGYTKQVIRLAKYVAKVRRLHYY
ncbi:MAG: glyceraldehyde-3-phosphate dehydrogenase [Salibacter sp.]|uniref:glyceraldehyde-3-phosphate dehydrogenase n=1 Tax=Salibacter sp. TaxID=2010995 RepID=UPI00286FB67F|nr:glyceraldehyde-3-phosphate dehydrogenase [Salibacter sp.]MDR9397763.1 glyceraldehyde-3-phosphate dehydrogenase [Salibacter sp.]